MEKIDELAEAVGKVMMIANEIANETTNEIRRQAPIIIHQRFCAKLVNLMRGEGNKTPRETPKAMEILTAISILEEIYPELISPPPVEETQYLEGIDYHIEKEKLKS